ncbi:Eco57I restriction-modification methylase domain-containing protein [Bhargavaea massiliensis]|uniref:Eco57I restriction-modification methylase domain-containing protein n=1 Tax=Bhargavaea massiliensis TaxID=2697500 RepID=UPI001BCA91B7|nr:N-6 DNA methylase [Bhargavaea massiliensis]
MVVGFESKNKKSTEDGFEFFLKSSISRLYIYFKEIYPNSDDDELLKDSIEIILDIGFISLAYKKGLFNSSNDKDLSNSLFEQLKTLSGNENIHWKSSFVREVLTQSLSIVSNQDSYESLSKLVESNSQENLFDFSDNRKEKGSYYTQQELVDLIVNNTMNKLSVNKDVEQILNLKILDPAVGGGAFLISAYNWVATHLGERNNNLYRTIVENCLYGVDVNVNALKVTAYSLWLIVGDPSTDLKKISNNLIHGDSLIATKYKVESEVSNNKIFSFSWEEVFPAVFGSSSGFDVIIGNPPWNKIKVHTKEFFSKIDPSVIGMQGSDLKRYINENILTEEVSKKKWVAYTQTIKLYTKRLDEIEHYRFQKKVIGGKVSGGDKDLYKYFVELSYNLVKEDGIVGLLIPASVFQTQSTTGIRELLFKNARVKNIITVENRDKVFPIDSRFKYSILIFEKKEPTESIQGRFMLNSVKEIKRVFAENDFLVIPLKTIENISPIYLTVPDFKNRIEYSVIKEIYDKFPLINTSNGWKISIHRELDMTNDSKYFIHENLLDRKEKFVPLYEGRMVNQFDYAAKEYISGEGRKAIWRNLNWDEKKIKPHYYLRESDAVKKFQSYNRVRPCYCDIAGQTNERAVQTALLPSGVICGNKVPTFTVSNRLSKGSIALDLIWVAITNSFVFDWIMRQRITTTINYFHWNQVPMPVLDEKSSIGKKLAILSGKLSLFGHVFEREREELGRIYGEEIFPVQTLEERQHLRAKIDALVAELFGLNSFELLYVLGQFPLLDRSQPSIGSGKSFVTRDTVLYHFQKSHTSKKKIENSEVYLEMSIEEKELLSEPRNLNKRINHYREIGAIAYIPG